MTNCTAKNPFNKVPGCPFLMAEELIGVLAVSVQLCVQRAVYRPLDGPGFLPS